MRHEKKTRRVLTHEPIVVEFPPRCEVAGMKRVTSRALGDQDPPRGWEGRVVSDGRQPIVAANPSTGLWSA